LWHSTSRALIVVLAGPTRSLRWELDTILIDADSWSKLLILMPPSTQQDNIAARNELVEALHDRPWRDALFGLEPHEIVAMRLMEDGGLAVVASRQRRMIDYVLAMRIILRQMRAAAARQQATK